MPTVTSIGWLTVMIVVYFDQHLGDLYSKRWLKYTTHDLYAFAGAGDIRDLNRNSENWAVVKAALVAGAYPTLARYDRQGGQLRSQ